MADFCFFKYRNINKRLLDSLVKSQLYFSLRTQLNDPFDCNVDISRALDQLLLMKEKDKYDRLKTLREDGLLLQKFETKISPLGICSFSYIDDETLMWSHYANDHKGVCLRYEFPKYFLNRTSEFLGISPVSYEPNSVSDWIYNNIDIYESDHAYFSTELLKKAITSKAPAWQYEKEVRIIRDVNGLYEIPRNSLTQIVFGFTAVPLTGEKKRLKSALVVTMSLRKTQQ